MTRQFSNQQTKHLKDNNKTKNIYDNDDQYNNDTGQKFDKEDVDIDNKNNAANPNQDDDQLYNQRKIEIAQKPRPSLIKKI